VKENLKITLKNHRLSSSANAKEVCVMIKTNQAVWLIAAAIVCSATLPWGCGDDDEGDGNGGPTGPPDTTPPTVVSTSPESDATEVEPLASIRVTFSESMNTQSAEQAFSIEPAVTGSITWANSTLVFQGTSALTHNTAYTVTIGTSASDVAGNQLAEAYAFSFTTRDIQIAFVSTRDGDPEILVMDADGTNQRQLTNNTGMDIDPSWSPDRSRIAFASDRAGRDAADDSYSIYVMNADGTGAVSLTTGRSPAWSPDGTKIVFSSARASFRADIYVMNADGSGVTPLAADPESDVSPVWTPDGQKIVFTSYRDGDAEIFIMNADGSNLTKLTDNEGDWDGYPSVSRDGTKIAFATDRGGGGIDKVYVMDIDGTNQRQRSAADDSQPCYSWVNNRICFASRRHGDQEIYVMNEDGSGLARLTSTAGHDYLPDW
jgi:Tol biopolymer transport system component